MKVLTVMFPAYASPNTLGGTPQAYAVRSVNKFIKELRKISARIFEEQHACHELVRASYGDSVERRLMTRYTVHVADNVGYGDITMLLVEHLGVPSDDIIFGEVANDPQRA